MKDDLLAWLKKMSQWLKSAGIALQTAGALLESLVVMLGGPGSGFSVAQRYSTRQRSALG